MFSELIYTRCRQGIDILKSGNPISSDGFKVYFCAPSLIDDNKTDLPFLNNAALGKQSYSDPSFMDDAYLYFVPDKGDALMIDFHPIPYDKTARGNYSHRAGNFINQILIGDYSGFYPFELFRDSEIWNAKARGEVYYYESDPSSLPVHRDVCDPPGQIGIDDLADFISKGRQEALMKAVSFLISQYQLPAEKRKFLVIRDQSSVNIELWIAAIEHAFSPRIAAGLPFATRMDKFTTANRYTVNQQNLFQTQINLQDPNQKQRYRAMIVGVDERDKVNAATARPLVNAPYVLLDGTEKRTHFDADITHKYYQFITSFTEDHQSFCREFLQMLDIREPGKEILSLFDIYTALFNPDSPPTADALSEMLAVMGKYRMYNYLILQNLYKNVTDDLPRLLKENLFSAFQIIAWLKTTAPVIGDHNAPRRLSECISHLFAEQLFMESDTERTFKLWESIKRYGFASDIAEYITASTTLQMYIPCLKNFNTSDALKFVLIYLECTRFVDNVSKKDLESVIDYGLRNYCAPNHDMVTAKKIVNALSGIQWVSAQEMLLSIAGKSNRAYAEFLVHLLIKSDPSVLASDESMLRFIGFLQTLKMESLIVPVLIYRIQTLNKPAEIEQFISLIQMVCPLAEQDAAAAFEALDQRLIIADKGVASAAAAIQRAKPNSAICSKSAHIYALDILNDKRMRDNFINIYKTLILQRFPSDTDPDYVRTLTTKLLKAQLSINDFSFIIQVYARVPAYIAELVRMIIYNTSPKRSEDWVNLISIAAGLHSQAVDKALFDECVHLNKGGKVLKQLSDMLVSKSSQVYFAPICKQALIRIHSQKSRSFFGIKYSKQHAYNDPGNKTRHNGQPPFQSGVFEPHFQLEEAR